MVNLENVNFFQIKRDLIKDKITSGKFQEGSLLYFKLPFTGLRLDKMFLGVFPKLKKMDCWQAKEFNNELHLKRKHIITSVNINHVAGIDFLFLFLVQ